MFVFVLGTPAKGVHQLLIGESKVAVQFQAITLLTSAVSNEPSKSSGDPIPFQYAVLAKAAIDEGWFVYLGYHRPIVEGSFIGATEEPAASQNEAVLDAPVLPEADSAPKSSRKRPAAE